jgi:hypothetical protein
MWNTSLPGNEEHRVKVFEDTLPRKSMVKKQRGENSTTKFRQTYSTFHQITLCFTYQNNKTDEASSKQGEEEYVQKRM